MGVLALPRFGQFERGCPLEQRAIDHFAAEPNYVPGAKVEHLLASRETMTERSDGRWRK